MGQSFEVNNSTGINQDFNIKLSDGENSSNIKVSDVTDLIYPDEVNAQWGREPRTVMQSVFIPIDAFKNSDMDLKRSVK